MYSPQWQQRAEHFWIDWDLQVTCCLLSLSRGFKVEHKSENNDAGLPCGLGTLGNFIFTSLSIFFLVLSLNFSIFQAGTLFVAEMSSPVTLQCSFNKTWKLQSDLLVVAFHCRFVPQSSSTKLVCRLQKNTRKSVIYDLHVLQSQELQWLLMEDWNVAGKYMTFVFNCSWKMNNVMQVFLFVKMLHKWCERFYVFTTLFVQHSLTIGVRFLVSLGSVRDKCNGRLALVYMLFLKHGLISMTCHLGQKSENQ